MVDMAYKQTNTLENPLKIFILKYSILQLPIVGRGVVLTFLFVSKHFFFFLKKPVEIKRISLEQFVGRALNMLTVSSAKA